MYTASIGAYGTSQSYASLMDPECEFIKCVGKAVIETKATRAFLGGSSSISNTDTANSNIVFLPTISFACGGRLSKLKGASAKYFSTVVSMSTSCLLTRDKILLGMRQKNITNIDQHFC